MSRSRIKRKNTWIDMTPFVDVAFLILTFFILVTKFKNEDIVTIQTPSSVSSQVMKNEKDAVIIMFDKTGKIYFQVAENIKSPALESMVSINGAPFDAQTTKEFDKSGIIATAIEDLPAYYSLPEKEREKLAVGIPSNIINNELFFLIRDIHSRSEYTAFKRIIKALKDNDVYEFSLITSTEQIPSGTSLSESSRKK
jgi:biopolymer transport protein ExbD